MYKFRLLLSKIPFAVAVLMCLTIGLAPFTPEPHIWEKLKMIADGQLSRPMDIFDLFLHGSPWVLLALKGVLRA